MLRLLSTYFLLFLIPLLGQNRSSQLTGRVLDPDKQPVPDASIVVEPAQGGMPLSSKTNDRGEFSLALPAGRYRLSAKRKGFEDQLRPVNMRNRDQQVTLGLQLKQQSASITVSDQAGQLDTLSDSHQDALKLSSSSLSTLPIKDGDVISALAFFSNPAGGQSPTIVVDGMERTDSVTLTPSQVDEVRLNNNAYTAEFSKPGKDRIEIDTKSGTDGFHGGFLLRVRNSIFDARNPYAATKPDFSRNGYELNLNGPLIRKKLFFFVSASRENQQQAQPIRAYLPTGLVQQQVLAPFVRDLVLGRLDWQAGDKHRLSLKYEFHQDQASNIGVGGFVLPSAGAQRFHHDYRIEFSHQYVITPSALNNFRFASGTNYENVHAQTDDVSIVVPGAFQEGGAQVNNSRREPRHEFQNTFSLIKGSLTIRTGGDARLHPFRSFNADNFGGTFQFASLDGFAANDPILYTLNAGQPLIVSSQDDYAWFLQTEKKFSRLTVFAGVRHEFQSHFDRYANIAPRIASAWSIDAAGQTVLRLGAGQFYDRRPPTILQQSLRFNGINTQQYIVPNPGYPFAIPFPNAVTSQNIATYPIDPSMTFPRVYQTSATLERKLPRNVMATVDFTFQRGTHLVRTRNINAPVLPQLQRPQPDTGNIDQIESSASSRNKMLNITLKTPAGKHYQLFAQYSLSWFRDDTTAAFGPPPPGGLLPPGISAGNLFSLPANNYDLRPEWGPSSSDIRHRFGLSATVQLPWRVNFGSLTSIHSGLPYDITTGRDDNQDTNPYDRPAGVTRNTARAAGYFTIDLHLARPVSFETHGHKIDIEVAADSFNVLNHTNSSSYVGVETSPLFEQPNAAYDGREMQLSIRAHF